MVWTASCSSRLLHFLFISSIFPKHSSPRSVVCLTVLLKIWQNWYRGTHNKHVQRKFTKTDHYCSSLNWSFFRETPTAQDIPKEKIEKELLDQALHTGNCILKWTLNWSFQRMLNHSQQWRNLICSLCSNHSRMARIWPMTGSFLHLITTPIY